jgi:hypothetical protein
MQGIEEAYYCVPTIEDRWWDDLINRMGLVDNIVGQEGPLMADPCSEEQMTSNNKKIDDICMNGWLKLQEKAKLHDNLMKELVTSHVEDQQRSVPRRRPSQANGVHKRWDLTSKSAGRYQASMVQTTHPRRNMG